MTNATSGQPPLAGGDAVADEQARSWGFRGRSPHDDPYDDAEAVAADASSDPTYDEAHTGAHLLAGSGDAEPAAYDPAPLRAARSAPAAGRHEKPSEVGNVARGSLLMASGSLVSRVLGIVRNMWLINIVGGTMSLAGNAWQFANMLPTTVYMLLAAGAINAIFVPQITKAAREPDGGRVYIDRLLTLSLVVLFGATVVAVPLASPLVSLFAKFPPEQHALAVRFAVVVLPSIFFYGLYAVLGQILSAQNRFGAYGWAPAACNILWVLGLGLFTVRYPGQWTHVEQWTPEMILLLGGTMTLGVAVQALVLLLPLVRSGWRFRPRFDFRGVGLGATGRVAVWTLGGVAVAQGALALASRAMSQIGQGEGVNKVGYDNGFFIFMTPHGLVTVSLVTALFTAMSTAAAAKDLAAVRGQLRRGLRLIGVAMVPITVLALCLAQPGMRVYIFRGTPAEQAANAAVFAVLVVALLPYGVLFLVQRAFYAFEDARTPFYLSAIAAAIFGGGSLVAQYLLPDSHVTLGVAAGATLSDVVAGVVGMRWIGDRLGGMRFTDVWESWTKTAFASLFAGLCTLGVVALVQRFAPGLVGAVLTVALGGVVFGLVFIPTGRLLRITELGELLAPVRRRLPGASRGRVGRD